MTATVEDWVDPTNWAEAVRQSDLRISSWPGPRPLTADHGGIDFLVGRDKDLDDFIRSITFYRLTHLTGTSGVGKSSLLMAGIIPELRHRGYVVASCRDWSNVTGDDFDIFLAQQLHASLLPDEQKRFSRNTDIFWELHDLEGEGVIILDQFEEIVRRSQTTRKEVFDFLTQLYVDTGIPVVLSYRSEYVHVFRSLDRDMRIDRTYAQEVEPVDPAAGLELIRHPRPPAGTPAGWDDWTSIIEEDAANAIHADWSQAVSEDSLDRIPVGMLHLQALLYVLSCEAREGAITKSSYLAWKAKAHRAGWTEVTEIMGYALEASAQTRVAVATQVAQEMRLDSFLRRGIIAAFADVVPHLSSGGFKLERDVAELADMLLEQVHGAAREHLVTHLEDVLDGEGIDAAMSHLVLLMTTRSFDRGNGAARPILASPRAEIMSRLVARLGGAVGEEHWQAALTAPGVSDLGAGPVQGLNALVVMIEQLRRLGWCMWWLHELNFARLDSDGRTRGTVTLVHDGLGDALKRWSSTYDRSNATESLYALIAPEGKNHLWAREEDRSDLCGAPGAPRVHVNLGFKGNAVIGADLRHAVFANCDFRGTLFLRCSFTGVTFLNCRLDGALFSDCQIEGGPADVSEREVAKPDRNARPTYLLNDPDGTLGSVVRRYREDGGRGDRILSQVPGLPAVATDDHTAGQVWVPRSSGLLIQGSRLSALTFRGTTFVDGASLTFLRVRGSGLDIAELVTSDVKTASPRIEIIDSVVRHAAFTAAGNYDDTTDTTDPPQPSGAGRFVTITASWSILAQCWVGRGVAGTLTAKDCMIGQTWVESPELFTATSDRDSVVTGLVGMVPDQSGERFELVDRSESLTASTSDVVLSRFRDAVSKTDYRRD